MTSSKLAVLLGTLLLGLVVVATPVLAHSELKESTPLDGQTMRRTIDQVELVFWSPFSDPTIDVFGPDGVPIEGHTTQVDEISVLFGMDPLTDEGEYMVRYEVRSGDGDLADGILTFVFAPDPTGQRRALFGLVVAAITVALVWWVAGRVTGRGARSQTS